MESSSGTSLPESVVKSSVKRIVNGWPEATVQQFGSNAATLPTLIATACTLDGAGLHEGGLGRVAARVEPAAGACARSLEGPPQATTPNARAIEAIARPTRKGPRLTEDSIPISRRLICQRI